MNKTMIIKSICICAAKLDKVLASLGYSFLSNEGKIFCNAVNKDGSMVKNITGHPDVSLRSACMAFEKMEEKNIVKKIKSQKDARSYLVFVNYEILSQPNCEINIKELEDIANDNSGENIINTKAV
jgi:DNA-binding MarR family transcriptional regulator